MSKALDDIAAERRRQVEVERWSAQHDDQHRNGEMAIAAACYAYHGSLPADARADLAALRRRYSRAVLPLFLNLWPWSEGWWRPKDQRADLVRAGALIVAEIERLDRAAERQG